MSNLHPKKEKIMNRKLLTFNLVFLIIFFVSAISFAAPLELVTLQYPPYEYEENGQAKGIAVEVIREAFSRMQQPITIKVIPWARAILKIEHGDADAIFTAYKTPERETFADYSSEILMPQVVSLFVKKNSPIVFDGDISKLNQYQFGAVRKMSYGKSFDTAVKNGVLTNIQLVTTGEQNFKKLLADRVDIVVSNKYGAVDILKQMNKFDMIKELSPELQSLPSYIAFSKKRNLAAIRDKFDAILKQMKNDGSYDKIINSYFNQ